MTTCKQCRSIVPDDVSICPNCGRAMDEPPKIPPRVVLIPPLEDADATIISPKTPLASSVPDPQKLPSTDADLPTLVEPSEENDQETPAAGFINPIIGGAASSASADAPAVPGTPSVGGAPSVPCSPNIAADSGPHVHETTSFTDEIHTHHHLPDASQQSQLQDAHQLPQVGHSAHVQPDAAHVLHQQPQIEYGEHAQPDASHLLHQQSELEHGAHVQPDATHALHQQPQVGQAGHVQPGAGHALHQQAPALHAQHAQPQALHAVHQHTAVVQHGERASRGCRLSCLQTAVASGVVVVAAVVAIVVLRLIPSGASSPPPPPPPGVAITGSAFPGGSVVAQGSHFTSGSTVYLSLDNQPVAFNGQKSLHQVGTMSLFQMLMQQSPLPGTPITVASDGTFSKTVLLSVNW